MVGLRDGDERPSARREVGERRPSSRREEDAPEEVRPLREGLKAPLEPPDRGGLRALAMRDGELLPSGFHGTGAPPADRARGSAAGMLRGIASPLASLVGRAPGGMMMGGTGGICRRSRRGLPSVDHGWGSCPPPGCGWGCSPPPGCGAASYCDAGRPDATKACDGGAAGAGASMGLATMACCGAAAGLDTPCTAADAAAAGGGPGATACCRGAAAAPGLSGRR